MKMKLFIPFGLLMMFFLFWKPLDASACSCMMLPPPEDALNEADAVFSGEVVKIIENGKITKGSGKTVHFKVNEVWKGTNESEVVITTGNNEGDCGIPFEEGQKYLVYATMSDMYVNNTLSTTICHRTTEFAGASGDLNALGEGREVSDANSSLDEVEDENNIPWWAFTIFVFGLLAIFIGFRYKIKQKNTRS